MNTNDELDLNPKFKNGLYIIEKVIKKPCLKDGKLTMIYFLEKRYHSKYTMNFISCYRKEISKQEYLEYKRLKK